MADTTSHTADDDADVIALLRAGALPDAFDLLAGRYELRVYRLCHAFLRDAALAEDAAQDSLIRIWRALPGFDGRARLSSWIYAIARNRSLTAIARRRPAEPLTEELLERLPAPDAAADGDDGARLLRRFLDGLPDKHRVPLTLYYYEDRSVAQVATALGIPEATVKTHLARGRALLLDRLREAGLAEASLWISSTP